MTRLAGGLTVVHPLPSAINGLLVAALASVAGAPPSTALLLAMGMLGFQCSIGALNDLVDAERDAAAKPGNPVADGIVPVGLARSLVVAGGVTGVAVSALFGPVVLGLGLAGYACGIVYDLSRRAREMAWLLFAFAFPILVAWTWVAETGHLPPDAALILPLAALAGPAIQLANGLADRDADARAGDRHTLAVRLGPGRGLVVMACLLVVVHAAAWATIVARRNPPLGALVAAAVASLLAVAGVSLSAARSRTAREAGWAVQAASISLLGVCWLASTVREG